MARAYLPLGRCYCRCGSTSSDWGSRRYIWYRNQGRQATRIMCSRLTSQGLINMLACWLACCVSSIFGTCPHMQGSPLETERESTRERGNKKTCPLLFPRKSSYVISLLGCCSDETPPQCARRPGTCRTLADLSRAKRAPTFLGPAQNGMPGPGVCWQAAT